MYSNYDSTPTTEQYPSYETTKKCYAVVLSVTSTTSFLCCFVVCFVVFVVHRTSINDYKTALYNTRCSQQQQRGDKMKFIDQTKFGVKGNCNAACLATILGLQIEEIPNFCLDIPKGQNWQTAQNLWLAKYGVVILTIILTDEGKLPPINALADKIPCIISGKGPRDGLHHAVVGQYRLYIQDQLKSKHELTYLHDPHPSRTFLKQPTTVDFFLIINPVVFV